MKIVAILFLSLFFMSCQKQQKVDVNMAKQAIIDSMQTEFTKQKTIDSMQLEITKIKQEKDLPQNVTVVNQTPANSIPVNNVPAIKKGWSGTAKGAVIGAGTGALIDGGKK